MLVDLKTYELLIGPNCTVVFENDPLRGLLPSGDDLIVSMILEYGDADIKKIKVTQLRNIENTVYISILGNERVYGRQVDLAPINETETNSIFQLRFQFKQGQIVDFKDLKNKVSIGIGHDLYPYQVFIPDALKEKLIKYFA